VDGDGLLDLYVTDSTGPNHLFRFDGARFERIDAGGAALPDHQSTGAIFADYDNDGDPDLYVTGRGPDVLLANDAGAFIDVTAAAGLGDPRTGLTASFGDFDADGFVDLYVANWLCDDACDPEPGVSSRDALYHNNGDGTFSDVTHVLDPRLTDGAGFVASFLDFDDDGDADIYLVDDKGYPGEPRPGRETNRNVLWRNDGPGCGGWCFSEVAIQVGADARIDGMGLAAGDYDNDGDLDLYMSHTREPVLYRNDRGRFLDVAQPAGAVATRPSWGTAFLDYDNDGFLDLYLAVGYAFGPYSPNKLFHNGGDGTFRDVSEISGAADPYFTLGVATADVDRDGGVDLVIGNWDRGYEVYRNRRAYGAENHWIAVRLVGGGSVNRDAAGARVTIETTDGRSLMQEVINGSSLGSGSDLALHFGLGAAGVRALEVRWTDGRQDRYDDVAIDREVVLTY
jgi:hypothetical protein